MPDLKMDVSAPVVFGQEVLHFGTVAPDSFTTQTITVHLAPELAQDPRVFLVATDPRIVVRPASVQKAGRDSGAKPPGSALASQEERVYRVSLRATRMLGPVTASLRIFRMAPPGALRVVGVRKVRMLPAPTLIGPEVPVLGSVAGELSATPDSVIIPAVFQGDAITRSVDIQAVRTQASTLVPGLEVTADSPALTVAIMPLPIPPAIALTGSSSAAHEGASSGPISAPCARLLVTIATERIQPGLFNASVLLTAPDGTQLSVPVRALIQQPPRPTSGLRP